MVDFGVSGYQPRWLCSRQEVVGAHGKRLGALVGRTLTRAWVVWDLDDDTWFADCPVMFDFAGEQLTVDHCKFDNISLTWDRIDPLDPIGWADFRLRLRDDAVAGLVALHGRTVRAVDLIEWLPGSGDLADRTLALGFTFDGGAECVVYNGLDENGLLFDAPDERHARHRLG